MDLTKLNDWIQAFGIFALVASLIFVGIQLQQDRLIARAELTSETFQIVRSLQDHLTDSGFAKTFARMLEQPEELTFEEKLQIDGLFRQVRGLYLRECYMSAREIMEECDGVIRSTSWMFFGNRYGQSWWRANGIKIDETDALIQFPTWPDAMIENHDPDLYRQSIRDPDLEN